MFLWLTDPLVRKNLGIKHFNVIYEKRKSLDAHFPENCSEKIFEIKKGIKIKLQKHNRLTAFILLENFEEPELEYVSHFLKEGDIVFEIGANIGLHALTEALVVGDNGKVFAFEPAPETFSLLQENIVLNGFTNIKAFNIGLSNTQAVSDLNISKNYDAWNTLVDKTKLPDNKDIFEKTVEVTLDTLDNFIEKNKIDSKKIAMIKIDVEGWEKFVLEGARCLLSDFAPLLMVEFDENNTWAAGYTGQDLYKKITEFGYSIFRLHDGYLFEEPIQLHYSSQNLFAVKSIENEFLNRIVK